MQVEKNKGKKQLPVLICMNASQTLILAKSNFCFFIYLKISTN